MVPITSPWPFEQWGTDIIGPFPKAVGGYTFLVTAVDYFTKWVGPSHSEPSLGWLYRNSSENASFAASGFLGWSFRTTESSLLTIRSEDGARTSASDELPSILWSYRITPRSATQETPFSLTYGIEAVIPAEILTPNPRLAVYTAKVNDKERQLDLDLVEERRDVVSTRVASYKNTLARYYNARVKHR
ncbi:uncharacterized protein [Coffea arabica]|uniref:Uncharacterized protein n=1 Tax=Coffea arabica TaxID=13443 RepID=A0ABM4W314_COFAR